MRNKLFK